MDGEKTKGAVVDTLNRIILKIDALPLWCFVVVIAAINFLPYFILKEGSVFEIIDQLDEDILSYVLTARHWGEGLQTMPEMLGGINASGLQPAAILFLPLYKIFPTFWAFIIQYAVCFLAAFGGMYFCIRELTESNILSIAAAVCFSMLPLYPVYGLSIMGIPLIFYAVLCLAKRKNMVWSLILTVFFGLTSSLVYTGYAVLSIWAVFLIVIFVRKDWNKGLTAGFLLLTAVYIIVNYHLFLELILGESLYTSHREEMVNYAMPFWNTVKDVFLNSGQHARSYHKQLIVPIIFMMAGEGCCWKKLSAKGRKEYLGALGGVLFLAGVAVFYGVCKTVPVVAWKNSTTSFFHYFQIERYYWLYPAGWYLEFAVLFSIWWRRITILSDRKFWNWPAFKVIVLALILIPVWKNVKENSYLYMNVNQINNGSGITGYISWENFYAEDLMEEIETAIGRDMDSYRIAHLGINTTPALMHGFYTIDGYSTNYPLEYKHKFRQIIAKELEKNEQTRLYFDEWGSRCYLFNGATGNAHMLGKKEHIVYENLEFNMEALKELNCEYLFSCGEILNAEELGMEFLGYFETEKSYWGIFLYKIT